MILTVTLNPAIDETVSADRLVFEDRGYILARGESAGGRGLNASLVLHSWGVETLALVPSGGEAGRRLEQNLKRLGFPYEIIPIASGARTNLIITDRQGLTVKLNEPGPTITNDELEQFEAVVRRHLPDASWLLVCGSLPPGAPASFYRRLIHAAKQQGVKTLLDTDGEILQEGLTEAPTAVSPNRHEAARLLNKALITRQHFRAAAKSMLAMGAESAILSLGSRGAIAANGSGVLEVVPPRVDAVCPIGAGDALNAAFAWAITANHGFAEAARWGVAAGTATSILPGLQFASLEQTKAILPQVEIR